MLTEQLTTTVEDYHLQDCLDEGECPECGEEVINQSGCVMCPCCGWGKCG